MLHGLRARWNGVTGHELAAADPGGNPDPTMQRVKHLALKAILDYEATDGSPAGTLVSNGTATGPENDA